jgi:4-diphosphocytidyl-2-C-methyl-D-erythritol kinase
LPLRIARRAVSEEPVRVFAPAKINLFLHVGARRADGFHALESLVAFADVGDELNLFRAEEMSVVVDGPFAGPLSRRDNIVVKAARALSSRIGGRGAAKIVLKKNLPVSSGIGGGSADAAATLRGLAKLWRASLSATELHAIAEGLGSDVPVCLASAPSWIEGRGERLTAAPELPDVSIVLVNPGIPVATAEAFAALRERSGIGAPKPPGWKTRSAFVDFLAQQTNDLEPPAQQLAPLTREALNELRISEGVLLARMSGSGATSFGLFGEAAAAVAAASCLRRSHPRWWVVATTLRKSRIDQ